MAAYYLIDSIIERVRATMRDVTIQTLALEDVFIKNEKEQEKRDILEARGACPQTAGRAGRVVEQSARGATKQQHIASAESELQ